MKFSVIFKINFLSLSSLLELHWWIHFLLMVFHKAHRLSSFLFILLFFFFLWKIFKRYLWDHWFSCLFKSAIEALYWIPPFNHLAPKFLGFFLYAFYLFVELLILFLYCFSPSIFRTVILNSMSGNSCISISVRPVTSGLLYSLVESYFPDSLWSQ